MRISRREFVKRTAVTAGALCLAGSSGWTHADSRGEGRCLVLDLGAGCALRESLEGYCAVLGEQSGCLSVAERVWEEHRGWMIVPGAASVDSKTATRLTDVLAAGGSVLLESGAGFLNETEFEAHRGMLRENFGVVVEPPVDVWAPAKYVPYVSYDWPCETMVRDFSRLIPVAAPAVETIGRVGPLGVACKKQIGNGSMIFLGSPLGPTLRTGDLEARRWLCAVFGKRYELRSRHKFFLQNEDCA